MSDELFDKRYRPTTPADLNDPPQFAQPLETTKDAFVLGLRTFFDQQQVQGRLRELPTIQKYQAGFDAGNDPFLTTVEIVQEFPDILERLPHISVTAASARNRRMTIGVPLIDQVQYPPRVEASATGPFDLSTATGVVPAEYVLRYRTQPERRGVWVESQVILRQSRFADWTQATVQDVVRVINEQALFARAFVTAEGTVAIECGGPAGGDVRPNVIEVLGTSTPGILTLLGFTAGQTDNVFNTTRPPANRYHLASEVVVNIDVLSVDVNTRRELTDLIYGWAIFWLERDFYELQGRTWTDEDVNDPQEWWHIVFHQEVSVGQFQAFDRPQSGKDKAHVQRVTVPVTTYQYIDRPVRTSTGGNFILSTDILTEDPDLPGAS
jgi:hypothetical protein